LTPPALQTGFSRFVWLQIGKIKAIFRRAGDAGGVRDVIFEAAVKTLAPGPDRRSIRTLSVGCPGS
jgi:hypothetical protein